MVEKNPNLLTKWSSLVQWNLVLSETQTKPFWTILETLEGQETTLIHYSQKTCYSITKKREQNCNQSKVKPNTCSNSKQDNAENMNIRLDNH